MNVMSLKQACSAAAIALAIAVAGQSQAADNGVPLITPVGITLQDTQTLASAPEPRPALTPEEAAKKTPGFFPGGGFRRGEHFVFADDLARPLYVFEDDVKPGTSVCVDACAEQWLPVQPRAGAQAGGQWSIITRPDKTKQWAYRGKPVYRFAGDESGQTNGLKAGGPKWQTAKFDLEHDLKRPPIIGIEESRLGGGYVLADHTGLTLYAFQGKGLPQQSCVTSACLQRFEPVVAPGVAGAIGEFTPVVRPDGIVQWAYKGKPLFTYSGDFVAGDVFGIGVSKDFQPTMIVRHWMPPEAGLRLDLARGPIVTKDKMTLYRLDTSFHQPDGHGIPGSAAGSPKVGKAMGTASCDDVCLKTWQPYVAPAGAVGTGHWEIVTRQNGTRQWAYRGFAMYTYPGDKTPIDRAGSDTYQFLVTDDLTEDVYDDNNEYGRAAIRGANSAARFWAYAEP
jgi:predicted lipoprotein with Yx(FWY)xxD motif